jgi:LacI family transcriptional regulator
MPPNEQRPVTIRDVARLSGVSIATVTRTFQSSPRVRPETSARVRAAAERLGYRPDAVAQALVTGRSQTIGLLVPSLLQAYWDELADAIEHRAGELGYSVVLASSRGEPDRERAMLDLLLGRRLDGMIVGGVSGDPHSWPSAESRRPPLVLIDWDSTPQWDLLEDLRDAPLTKRLWRLPEQTVPGDWVAHLSHDDVAAARLITQHLIDLGHREIGFVAGPPVRTCLLRLLGVRSALEDAGLTLRYTQAAQDNFECSRLAGAEALSMPSPPTALVCYSDVVAIGIMRAAHDLGLSVPRDVSITGFDDIEIASYVDPQLTTIQTLKLELGELALDLLLNPPSDGADKQRRLMGTLVVRGSTAPPRGSSAKPRRKSSSPSRARRASPSASG